ncbi:MAG: chaperone NapD, partial [Motiliproteus sp.]
MQDDVADQELFDITGLVVRTQPEKAQTVADQLELLKGVEVHAIGDKGNLVVTIEELDGEKLAVDTLTQIN